MGWINYHPFDTNWSQPNTSSTYYKLLNFNFKNVFLFDKLSWNWFCSPKIISLSSLFWYFSKILREFWNNDETVFKQSRCGNGSDSKIASKCESCARISNVTYETGFWMLILLEFRMLGCRISLEFQICDVRDLYKSAWWQSASWFEICDVWGHRVAVWLDVTWQNFESLEC